MGGPMNTVARRLSKPRTSTSSSDLLSWSDTPAPLSSPSRSLDADYFGEHPAAAPIPSESRSRRKSKSKIRAYLHGSPHQESRAISSDEDDERQNSLAGAARVARKRLSRTGSSIMQLSSAKASSNHISCASTTNLYPSSDSEESARVAEQIKERALLDSQAALNHVSSLMDESTHINSYRAPVRRKSLYTPGIATRSTSDILRKPPPPESIQTQADRDYYYNSAYPESSPLSRIAGLMSEDRRSATPDPCTQLGGLQLGTLRVINGTTPIAGHQPDSPVQCPTTSVSPAPESFHTANEGSDWDGQPEMLYEGCASQEPPNGVPHPTNMQYSGDEQSYPVRLDMAPRQTTDCASAIADEYMADLGDGPFVHGECSVPREPALNSDECLHDKRAISMTPHHLSDDLSNSQSLLQASVPTNGTREDALYRLTSKAQKPMTDRSLPSTVWGGIASIDSAPTFNSGYSSNSFLATEDNRESSHRILDTQQAGPQQAAPMQRVASGPRALPRAMSMLHADALPTNSPPSVRPSFTTIPRYAMSASGSPITASKAPEPLESVRPAARSSSQNVLRKLRKARPKSQPPPARVLTTQICPELADTHIPRVPSLIAVKHAERIDHFPLLEHTFPSSNHVTVSTDPLQDVADCVPFRFPSPDNHGAPTASLMNVPSIPQQAMSLDLHSTPPGAIQTIDNDNDWGASSIVRSPSWSAFSDSKQKLLQKRIIREQREAEKKTAKEQKEFERKLIQDDRNLKKQMKRDESKERRSSRSRSRRPSWGRAKSSERRLSEHEAQAIISDFGTVTESLGRSPYDIARSQKQSDPRDTQRTQVHPHQMTTAMPRTKSMYDPSDAPEVPQTRGRPRSQTMERRSIEADHAHRYMRAPNPQTMAVAASPIPAISAIDLKQHGSEWARSKQKARSISRPRKEAAEGISVDNLGTTADDLPRPQSMFAEAPPVPALPLPHQVKEREARIARLRPQSMNIESRSDTPLRECLHNDDAQTNSLPGKTRASKVAIPDLWTSGSLEKKSSKGISPDQGEGSGSSPFLNKEATQKSGDTLWEAQKQAWRQRRNSAGEALFLKKQLREIFNGSETVSNTAGESIQENRSRPVRRSITADPSISEDQHNIDIANRGPQCRYNSMSPNPDARQRATPKPRSSPAPDFRRRSSSQKDTSILNAADSRPPHPESHRIPRKRVGSGASTPRGTSGTRSSSALPPPCSTSSSTAGSFPSPGSKDPIQRLIGRYEGGLLYGYEPGHGLGGSAGTRSQKTVASRKSLEVSQGFGIDLSDVPIFVAPAQCRA